MKIIVGLGNPGPRYRATRHNVGYMVADSLAEGLGAAFAREKYQALIAEATFKGERVMVLKPLTFMNNSGLSVARALRYSKADLTDLLVIVDDVNLGLGRLRLRLQGSAGGHNGLKSIIAHAAGREFSRLRIGIGRRDDAAALTGHVLGKFAPDEMSAVKEAVDRATEAAQRFITDGAECAMNEFN